MRTTAIEVCGVTCYREPMRLELAELPPGLVAVVGPNGAGKSTLLECAAPVTLTLGLPSRAKPLKDYCVRRDARIAHAFEHAGHAWQSVVQIDPDHSGGRGKVEAFLTRDGEPIEQHETPGRVRDYQAAVRELLPDAALYLASAYSAQGGAADFFSLDTPGRRDLFTTLLGSEYAQRIATRATEHRKQLDALLVEIERDEKRIAEVVTRADELDARLSQLAEAGPAIAKRATEMREASQLQAAITQQIRAEADAAGARAADLQRQHDQALTRRDDAAREMAKLQAAANGDRLVLAKAGEVRAGVQQLAEARERRAALAGEYQAAQAAHREAETRYRTETERATADRRRAETRLQDAQAQAARLDTVPCGGASLVQPDTGEAIDCSACDLIAEAAKARDAIPTLTLQAESTTTPDLVKAEFERPVAKAQAELDRVTAEGKAVRETCDALAWADDRGRELGAAEARQPGTGEAIDAAAQRLAACDKVIDELPPVPETGELRERQRAAEAQDAEARQVAERAATDLERHRVAVAHTQGQREALGTVTATADELAKRREAIALRRAGFRLIERGFGRDGLQALEIDAAGPHVSALANQLLHASFGPRFSIALQTVRPAEGARKAREVFDVLVHDGDDDGGARSIGDLSGGEKVLISEALKAAIALYNAQRNGVTAAQLFRDEVAGALDEEMAARYPAMLRRAMEIGGFRNVIFVTHNSTVAAQADVRIDVGGGSASWEVQL